MAVGGLEGAFGLVVGELMEANSCRPGEVLEKKKTENLICCTLRSLMHLLKRNVIFVLRFGKL